jgi:hypothetical protein
MLERSTFAACVTACIVLLAALPIAAASPVVIGPVASTQYDEAFSVHGIGGDERLIFAVQGVATPDRPLGVWVSHRLDGSHLGQVTPPPGGWSAPVAMKVTDYNDVGEGGSEGDFIVLDSFTPQEAGTRPGIVYTYHYAFSFESGLATTLTGTHVLPLFTGVDASGNPDGPAYPISLVHTPSGEVVVIDMILGSIWASDPTLDNWRLAILDPRFELGELEAPLTGIDRAPGGGVRPYTFSTVSLPPAFPFPFLPGIHGVTYCTPTDEIAVVRTASPGGIYGIPASVLLDATVSPDDKGASVREIAAPNPGVTDLAAGVDYDRFNPQTPWLYWQRSVSNQATGYNTVYRVNLFTGVEEKLVESVQLYNWTNEISVLPSSDLGPFFTVLTSANDQDENLAQSNALLDGVSTLVGPTVIPVAAFSNW